MARAPGVTGEADHCNGVRPLQQFGNRIQFRHGSHAIPHFLFAASSFCLNIFMASLRIVSETSLLAERFFKSATNRFFIKPRPRSSGVRGLATRLRTTM